MLEKKIVPLLIVIVMLGCSSRQISTQPRERPNPMSNSYPGFDASSEDYLHYARKANAKVQIAARGTARSLICLFPQKPEKEEIVLLNPGDSIDILYRTPAGEEVRDRLEVGANRGTDFECMGACGPACPESGIPVAFTLDCLLHDHCNAKYGIKRHFDRDKHPECGDLFIQAVDDWCKYGHFSREEE